MLEAIDIYPLAHVPPWLSAAIVYGLGVAGYLVTIATQLRAWSRWRHQAKLADASVDRKRPLTEGEIVLVGVVEGSKDDDPAVRVLVEQQGTEQENSGSWSHLWSETNRRMQVRPFNLRLASGERVLVEPTREALLIDALDGIVHLDRTHRIRTAELTPGETVVVTGVLQRRTIAGGGIAAAGYRDGAMGWVLTPPRKERMILCTEPLGKRFRRRAVGAMTGVVVGTLLLMTTQALVLGYHLRAWRGETIVGTVAQHYTYETESDDDTTTHYVVVARAGAHVVQDEVYSSGYLAAAEGAPIAVRIVPGAPWASTVGATATASKWPTIPIPIGLVLTFFVVGLVAPARWHEVRVKDSGKGKLPEPKPPRPRGR